MSKFLYRLWIPQANIHGECFDKICEKCQNKIEEKLEDGFVLPTTVSIDTSIGLSIKFGFSMNTLELCKTCEKEFREWLDCRPYFSFNNEQIQLWKSTKEA